MQRSVNTVDPWDKRVGSDQSLNALLAGHDDDDYYLGLGAGISFLGNFGAAEDLRFDLGVERARSMATRARSRVNDWLGGSGQFPENPGIREGDYVTSSVSRRLLAGPLDAYYGVDGLVAISGPASAAARFWASARVGFGIAGRTGVLSLKAGTVKGDDVPQLRYRIGGPQTVRGYVYGTRTGRSLWSAQLDLGLSRRSVISPVIFADVGNHGVSGTPLSSAGAGLSFFNGLVRLNLAKGLTPRAPIRFDLLFRAAR